MEEEVATHSSVLAWRIPWTASLVGCSSWGCKESDTTEVKACKHSVHQVIHSLGDGRLGCFHVLTMVNQDPLNICVHNFCADTHFPFFWFPTQE